MNWPTVLSSVFSGVGAGALGSLLTLWLTHRLNIDRDRLAEERLALQKRREASAAIADILGEWIKPNYLGHYTNDDRWQIQTTYWRNILSLDKRLVDILLPRLANRPDAVDTNDIIVEARRILLNLKERDLKPTDLNNWRPEHPTSPPDR
jgi:hypothetical protein